MFVIANQSLVIQNLSESGSKSKNIVIIGCGGHAKVVIDIIESLNNYNILGFYDDNKIGTFCPGNR